jgi:hypothetical protein
MLKIEDVIENVTGYIESRVEIIKLDVKDHATEIGVATLVWSIVGFFGLMTLGLLSIALALYLGHVLASMPLGFVLVAGLYVIVALVLIAFKSALHRAVEKRVFPTYKRFD